MLESFQKKNESSTEAAEREQLQKMHKMHLRNMQNATSPVNAVMTHQRSNSGKWISERVSKWDLKYHKAYMSWEHLWMKNSSNIVVFSRLVWKLGHCSWTDNRFLSLVNWESKLSVSIFYRHSERKFAWQWFEKFTVTSFEFRIPAYYFFSCYLW